MREEINKPTGHERGNDEFQEIRELKQGIKNKLNELLSAPSFELRPGIRAEILETHHQLGYASVDNTEDVLSLLDTLLSKVSTEAYRLPADQKELIKHEVESEILELIFKCKNGEKII